MSEPITPGRLAEIRERDERALGRAEDPSCSLSQAEYDRTLVLDEMDRLKARLEAAEYSLRKAAAEVEHSEAVHAINRYFAAAEAAQAEQDGAA